MYRTYLQAAKSLSRDAIYLIVAVCIHSATVFSGMHAVLFNIFLLRMGYDTPFIGTVISAGFLLHAVFAFLAGATLRGISHRTKMLIGLCILVVTRLLLPLADLLPEAVRSPWILITYVLSTSGSALFFVCSKPYLMFATGSRERNHAFAFQGALQPLAAFFGAFLGGFFPTVFASILGVTTDVAAPFRYSLMLPPILLLGSVSFLKNLTPDRIVEKADTGETKKNSRPLPLIVLFSLFVLLTGAGSGTIRAFFNVYLDRHFLLPTYKIGIITAIGQGMAAPAAFLVPVFISKLGKNKGLAVASTGIAIGVALVAFIPHWMGAGAGYVAAFVSIAVHGVIYNVLQLEIVPEYWRSTMAGTTLLAKGVGWAVISAIGGIIIARFGYVPYFSIGVLLPLLGVVLLWIGFRNRSSG